MPLADELRSLRGKALADLDSAHDYYTDTAFAWRVVRNLVKAGHAVKTRITGTVTTPTDLANKARSYVREQLAEATFQQFVSTFEVFVFDLLRLWLAAYPESRGKRTVDFEAVLAAPDKEAVARLVIDKELIGVAYQSPAEWFRYVETRICLGCPNAGEVERFAEIKATRDLLVHSRKVANRTYEQKASALSRFKAGERIDVPQRYHRGSWEVIRKMVDEMSAAAIAKAP